MPVVCSVFHDRSVLLNPLIRIVHLRLAMQSLLRQFPGVGTEIRDRCTHWVGVVCHDIDWVLRMLRLYCVSPLVVLLVLDVLRSVMLADWCCFKGGLICRRVFGYSSGRVTSHAPCALWLDDMAWNFARLSFTTATQGTLSAATTALRIQN